MREQARGASGMFGRSAEQQSTGLGLVLEQKAAEPSEQRTCSDLCPRAQCLTVQYCTGPVHPNSLSISVILVLIVVIPHARRRLTQPEPMCAVSSLSSSHLSANVLPHQPVIGVYFSARDISATSWATAICPASRSPTWRHVC